MPRFGQRQKETHQDHAPATVFEGVGRIIDRVGNKDLINLHLGDSHTLPPPPARPSKLDEAKRPGFGQYCQTAGIPELKELLVEKLKTRNRMEAVGRDNIQVTCGAIHGMYSAFSALLDRGEEVIALSPHWHLTNDVILQAGGVPVDADFHLPLLENPQCDVKALLEKSLSPRTAAIYMNTPCNPVGNVLGRAVLQEVADFAAAHDLWIVSDEAYEDFIYTNAEHVSIATLPGMQDRTVSVFTFSKCLAAAGYRVGYTVANTELTKRIHRASTRTVYNAPTDNQHLVVQALQAWDDWFPELYERYRRKRDLVVEKFKGRFFHPEGSFYVFFDARNLLKGKDPETLLEEMIRNGVAVVPGWAFGKGFEEWFRLCFVAVPDEALIEGIERLNRVVAEK